MRRSALLVIAAAVVVLGTGCGSSGPEFSNRFGDCVFEPGTTCTNQDFTALNLESSDLTGANFSGSNFRNADLRNVILRNANLSGTQMLGADLTGADLRGADLSGAELFSATMDNVRWAGANRTGIKLCQTLLPNGTVSDCPDLDNVTPPPPKGPPAIVTFAPHEPVRCIVDAIGEGIEVDWKVRNAESAVFLVDDVEASTQLGSGGIKRLPFPCDHHTHTVTIKVSGDTPPVATRSFDLKLGPTRPRVGI